MNEGLGSAFWVCPAFSRADPGTTSFKATSHCADCASALPPSSLSRRVPALAVAAALNRAALRQTDFLQVFFSDYHRGNPLRAAAVCLSLEFSGSSSDPATLHLAFPSSRAAFSEVGLLPRLQRGTWTLPLRCLTFELSGRQRQDALARTEKMYRVPQAGPRWPAVGAPLERGVRRHRGTLMCEAKPSIAVTAEELFYLSRFACARF